MLQHPLFCCNTSLRLPHKRLDNLYTERYHQTQLYNKTKINAKITMLNIIKNSFITFYKYLPVLILLGGINQIFLHYNITKETHPLIYYAAYFSKISILIIIFSNIKKISVFKTWKFWTVYTVAFVTIKIISKIANAFFMEIFMFKIIYHIDILFNIPTFVILQTLCLSYLDFCLTIPLCMIINQDKLTIKNIKNILSYPYWKIITFLICIDVLKAVVLMNNSTIPMLSPFIWFLNYIFLSFVVNFYKSRKQGTN